MPTCYCGIYLCEIIAKLHRVESDFSTKRNLILFFSLAIMLLSCRRDDVTKFYWVRTLVDIERMEIPIKKIHGEKLVACDMEHSKISDSWGCFAEYLE